MIFLNDTDYEVINKVKQQLNAHEFLVDPDDIRVVIRRFEMLLSDYESGKDNPDNKCSVCSTNLYYAECGEAQ